MQIVIQGDSRQIQKVREQADGIITSPPYNLPMSQDHNGSKRGKRGTTPSEPGAFVKYGDEPKQIEGLPQGNVDGVITSPPYAETIQGGKSGIDWSKQKDRKTAHPHGYNGGAYSPDPSNIGNLSDKGVDGVITSP